MREIVLQRFASRAFYVTDQAEADGVIAEILNTIEAEKETVIVDTEGGAAAKWKHEHLTKAQLPKDKKQWPAYLPGLDPFKSDLRLCQVGFRKKVYVIDLWTVRDWTKLRLLLQADWFWKWVHNGKHDYKQLLWICDIVLTNIVDSMAASKLLNLDAANLKYLIEHFTREILDKEEQTSDWMAPELTDRQLAYAAEDIAGFQACEEEVIQELHKRGHWRALFTESGSVAPAAEMELNGMKLDLARHAATVEQLALEVINGREDIWSILEPTTEQLSFEGIKRGINLKSNKQLLAALRGLGLDLDATNKTELTLRALDHPITSKVLAHKKVEKLIDAFGDTLLKFVHPVTGMIHPSLNLFFTVTWRLSCSKPNLQQIPRREDIRAWFVSPEGFVMVIADYSAIEMVGAAIVAGDEKLKAMFRRRLKLGPDATEEDRRLCDPHYVTGSIVTQKHIMEVVKKERQDAKPANFMFVYGATSRKFRTMALVDYGIHFSEVEAENARERFFSAEGYSALAEWHKDSKGYYKKEPTVRTIAGYTIPLEYSQEYDSFSGPAVLNYQVQNPAGVGNKRALALLWKEYRPYMNKAMRWKGPMLSMNVHDEAHLFAPESQQIEAGMSLSRLMKKGMDEVLRCDDLVHVEAHAGKSWAEK